MKTLPTLEQLGIAPLHFRRHREIGEWREVNVWGDENGIHVEPYKATYLRTAENPSGLSIGTLDLVCQIIYRAKGLGFDAWMCNDNPRNGGYIQAKKV